MPNDNKLAGMSVFIGSVYESSRNREENVLNNILMNRELQSGLKETP